MWSEFMEANGPPTMIGRLRHPRLELAGHVFCRGVGRRGKKGEADGIGPLVHCGLSHVLGLHPGMTGVEHPNLVSALTQHRREGLDA